LADSELKGERPVWPVWWQSPESTVLAGSELKLGIDLFAGKSEITEGCSDLREIGDSSDLPGISDVRLSRRYGSDAAGAAERREAGAAGAAELWMLRNFGAAAIGGAGGSGLFASVRLLEPTPC
jgi:hypothetical protein